MKAIKILEDNKVRFLDKTLIEAIAELENIRYVEKEKIQEEREVLLKASKGLHIAYALFIEDMAIKDFGASPNLDKEKEESWFDENIMRAEYQVRNDKLIDGLLVIKKRVKNELGRR